MGADRKGGAFVLSVIVILGYAAILGALAIWDIRRTFAKLDRRPRLLEPVDLGAEIRAYRLARDIEAEKVSR